MLLLYASKDDSPALLDLPVLKGSHKDVGELLIVISGTLANTSPQSLTDA
jgi:hypothetical protein